MKPCKVLPENYIINLHVRNEIKRRGKMKWIGMLLSVVFMAGAGMTETHAEFTVNSIAALGG
jgi:hypothetical protein